MTDEELALAKQLVAHERWEWRDGMGVSHVDCPQSTTGWISSTTWPLIEDDGVIPSLSDPATQGVLLGMVREVTHYSWAFTCGFPSNPPGSRWSVFTRRRTTLAPTEGAALAKALLATWSEMSDDNPTTTRLDVDLPALPTRTARAKVKRK